MKIEDMKIDELIEKFLAASSEYINNEGQERIKRALDYAKEKYEGIKSVDGTDYILHIVRSSIILTGLHSDEVALISVLVYDIPNKNDSVSIEDIEENFGKDVANISESLGKIGRLKLKDDEESSAIYLRKILVGLATDVRVIIIKLATRLDNLRYAYSKPSKEQIQKCISTEKVLIPIAHRLGINYIKSELEDLCLKYTKPDDYNDILDHLNATQQELNGYIEEMKKSLSQILDDNKIKYRIKGRVKSVHSLHDKLSKGKAWKDIYDLLALRIIVEKESECYLTIGLIHSKYKPIAKRFKDYIAQPKENMYQSIHTSVIGPNGNIFEVQVRTEEMDEIAECGVASHWSYKEHGTKTIQSLMEKKLEIFRESIEADAEDENLVSALEEMFTDEMIYVFSPKGDVIELPKGATPVDFAYKIHSRVGDSMVGAVVNDKIVSIDCKLVNDDIVKILTSEGSTPKKEWLNFVKTNQAKSNIKSFFNKQDREEMIVRGEELLNREIRKKKLSITDVLSNENVEKLISELKLKDFDDLKFAIGSLRYSANYVLGLLDEKETVEEAFMNKYSTNNISSKHDHKNEFTVAGCDDLLVSVANCCTPVYGDSIVGFITKGNGIIVHKKDCINVKDEDARLIEVSWNSDKDASYTTRILVKTNEVKNNLVNIVTKAGQRDVSITNVNAIERQDGMDYEILVDVPGLDALRLFMLDLESLPFVVSAERTVK